MNKLSSVQSSIVSDKVNKIIILIEKHNNKKNIKK